MLFQRGRKEAANATLCSGPGFLRASGLLSVRSAARSLRQQNNGQAELGAFHPDAKAKNDFSPHGYCIQHEGLGAEGSAQNSGGGDVYLSLQPAVHSIRSYSGKGWGDRVGWGFAILFKRDLNPGLGQDRERSSVHPLSVAEVPCLGDPS